MNLTEIENEKLMKGSRGMLMYLICKCCGSDEAINRKVKQGFEEIAYDGIIQWYDQSNSEKYGDSLPSLDEDHFIRGLETPRKGEQRFVKVQFPFNFDVGETFQSLFMPADSFFNGWDEAPEELEQSAIVTCKVKAIADSNEYFAWISVEVLDVRMLYELYQYYPDSCTSEPLEQFDVELSRLQSVQFRYRNWEYYDWNAQGDVGEWKLIYTDNNGVRHLILMGEWDFHNSNVYCGNIVKKGKSSF